jgi:hypothetical protein
LHDIRKQVLWGNLMAGGAGVEYYFGYKLPQNDLACEDWRSREQSWRYAKIALDFFRTQSIPFWDMEPADALLDDHTNFCLAEPNLYLVYLPNGGTANLTLPENRKGYSMSWFNPRTGNAPRTVTQNLQAAQKVSLGPPDEVDEDWLLILRSR